MASKRMFAKMIVDSDVFLDMPQSTQNLYFHLNIRADDDGFIDNPKKIMRIVGSNQNDLEILLSKRYVLAFDSGVIVIKHWKLHNTIQKDRYKPTIYQEEYQQLDIKENGAYTDHKMIQCNEIKPCIQDVSKLDTECYIDKSRLDKIKLDKNIEKSTKEIKHKYGEYNHVLLTDSQMKSVVEKLGEHKAKYMIKVMDEAIEEKGNIWHISNFAMALLKWAKKDTSYKPPQQTVPTMPRLPRPPKCPTCGKPTIEYMYGGAGCKPCGVMFRYSDKWIQDGK